MTDTSHTKYMLANIFLSSTYLPRSPPRARGCKNYPCTIVLRADRKINRDHRARLVFSIGIDLHTTALFLLYFTHSLHVYAGETIMPPQGPKPCGGNNWFMFLAVHYRVMEHLGSLESTQEVHTNDTTRELNDETIRWRSQ